MVGIFSRFSIGKSIHRRTQSALDQREMLPPISEVAISTGLVTASSHGIEVAVEFKPVEHPIEPLDNDRPIQCPLPEPSILHDGRIWKERASVTSMMRRADLPVVKEGIALESDIASRYKLGTSRPKRTILPSMSAPEHDILKLLEECNASEI